MGKREETEKQILNAAVQLISEKGYNATKTNEIAERARTSEAIIFKYYKTKKGLLTAIVNKAIELLGRELAYKPLKKILNDHGHKSIEEVFDLIIEDRVHIILKNHALIKVMLTEMQYHGDLRDLIIDQVISPLFMDFKNYIKSHKESGYIDPDLDDDVIFRTISVGLLSSFIKRIIMEEVLDESEIKRELEQIKIILLRGIIRKQ